MDKRVINLIAGVIIGLGAVAIIHGYIGQQQAELRRLKLEGLAVDVVVAIRDIPRETTISPKDVTIRTVNRNAFQPGDLTSLDSAIGKFAEVDILKGQHVNSNMVRSLGLAKYLSQTVPQGMRAITIPVDKISAIEGLIKPGDKVDIVGIFRVPTSGSQFELNVITVFKNVKILATNRNISQYTVSKIVGTITLALKPEDVRSLSYILEWGKLRLVLRAPLDTAEEYGYSAVTYETLVRQLGLYIPPPQELPEATIDVFRGTESEEAAVSR